MANRYNITATTTSQSIGTNIFVGTKEFLLIQNKGSNKVYIGFDEGIATADCYEVASGKEVTIPNDSVDVLSFLSVGGDSAIVIISI